MQSLTNFRCHDGDVNQVVAEEGELISIGSIRPLRD